MTTNRLPRWALVTAAFAALTLGACQGPLSSAAPADPSAAAAAGESHTITRVVDGDTLVVDGGTKIRVIGANTPETVKPDAPVECFGPEASAMAKSLLPEGTPVALTYDVERLDRYGRLLAYVTLPDGRDLSEVLISGGYARTMTIAPNTARADTYAAAESAARAAGVGLWGAC